MCRASVQGWYPMASDWCASSLWGKPWTSANHSLPSRSGQSQGPGQARSSQARTIGTLTWKVACVCLCVHVCGHTLKTRVGGDGDRIDLNCVCVCVRAHMCAHTGNKGWRRWRPHRPEPCVCVCVCVCACVHTLETRVAGDGNCIDLNCMCVCVYTHMCTNWKQWLEEMATS